MSDLASDLLVPKFLTKEIAEFAILSALRTVSLGVGLAGGAITSFPVKRRNCHVCKCAVIMCHTVIMVPSMICERAEDHPDYRLRPHLLCEYSSHRRCSNGEMPNEDVWPRQFDRIARSKGLQLWQERNDDRTDVMPHLLFPGETPYWGGVKRHGIVGVTSGVQPYFDKLISSITVDICVAMAYHAWKESDSFKHAMDFLA